MHSGGGQGERGVLRAAAGGGDVRRGRSVAQNYSRTPAAVGLLIDAASESGVGRDAGLLLGAGRGAGVRGGGAADRSAGYSVRPGGGVAAIAGAISTAAGRGAAEGGDSGIFQPGC